jgi:hypothetical protein
MIFIMMLISLVIEAVSAVIFHLVATEPHAWIGGLAFPLGMSGALFIATIVWNPSLHWSILYVQDLFSEKGIKAKDILQFNQIKTVGNAFELIGSSLFYTIAVSFGLLEFGVRQGYNMTLKKFFSIPIYSRTK